MRKIYFLFPHTGKNTGGYISQEKLFEITQKICPAQIINYEIHEDGSFSLDQAVLREKADSIFFIHWGPDVPILLRHLAGCNIIYTSHSTGYKFKLPADVPILAVSKISQAYWGKHAPNSLIYRVPDIIANEFTNRHLNRPIDILVQKRKSSSYLIDELVPALQPLFKVGVINSWVGDLAEEFNKSKVYLYDSTEYWLNKGISEGFGLPPLEAMACGCKIFSSLNDGLSEYLDPGIVGEKLRVYSKEYDVLRIARAVKEWTDNTTDIDPAAEYRAEKIQARLAIILPQLNDFFDQKNSAIHLIKPVYLAPRKRVIQAAITRVEMIGNFNILKSFKHFRIAIKSRILHIVRRSKQ